MLDDILDGGSGLDYASYALAPQGVSVNLRAGSATGDGADTLSSIENVTGSSNHLETITGNERDNVLDGRGGTDTIDGGLGNDVIAPHVASGNTSVWAQYTIRLPAGADRDGFAAALKAQAIPTNVYYARSLHQQTAFRDFPIAEAGLPVSEQLSRDVISLPMHPYLDEATQERIIKAVRGALST